MTKTTTIYIYIYICMYICIYVYIYIHKHKFSDTGQQEVQATLWEGKQSQSPNLFPGDSRQQNMEVKSKESPTALLNSGEFRFEDSKVDRICTTCCWKEDRSIDKCSGDECLWVFGWVLISKSTGGKNPKKESEPLEGKRQNNSETHTVLWTVLAPEWNPHTQSTW